VEIGGPKTTYKRVREAARLIGVPPATLKSWVKRGKVVARRRGPTGHWRLRVPATPIPAFNLFLQRGVVAPWIRRCVRTIAKSVALCGEQETLKAIDDGYLIPSGLSNVAPEAAREFLRKGHYARVRQEFRLLVAGVLRWRLYQKVRLAKQFRVYRPGQKHPLVLGAQKYADFWFLLQTYFDVTPWEDSFTWPPYLEGVNSEDQKAIENHIVRRVTDLGLWENGHPAEYCPEYLREEKAHVKWVVSELWQSTMMELELGKEGLAKIAREIAEYDSSQYEENPTPTDEWIDRYVAEKMGNPAEDCPEGETEPEGAFEPPKTPWGRELLVSVLARVLPDAAPRELLALTEKQRMGAIEYQFKELLSLGDKQRAIFTATLELRKRASRSGESVRRKDILREMEAQWRIRMSAGTLSWHFRRKPILERFYKMDNAQYRFLPRSNPEDFHEEENGT